MSNSPPNPYAPPVADAAPAVDKAYRVNLINRRSTAVLFELALWSVTGGALLRVLLLKLTGGAQSLAWAFGAAAPYWLLRDIIGFSNLTRRLVGLELTTAEGGASDRPTIGQRVMRNVLLVVPAMPLVEYFVAYYGDLRKGRLGDRIAGTRVVDVDRGRRGHGSYTGQMLGALALNWVASTFVGALIGK